MNFVAPYINLQEDSCIAAAVPEPYRGEMQVDPAPGPVESCGQLPRPRPRKCGSSSLFLVGCCVAFLPRQVTEQVTTHWVHVSCYVTHRINGSRYEVNSQRKEKPYATPSPDVSGEG